MAQTVAAQPVAIAPQRQTQQLAEHAKKRRTAIIVTAVVLGVAVIGAAVAAYFLTRNVKLRQIVNYADCQNEKLHHVTSALSGRNYWLGTLSGGMALFSTVPFVDNQSTYTLTAFGPVQACGSIASPMLGDVVTPSKQKTLPPTPPPPLAEFDFAQLAQGVTDAASFWAHAASTAITAGNGQVVARLAVIGAKTDTYDADYCFLCAPDAADGTKGVPLCMLGGLVWQGTPAVYYNVGFMPITAIPGLTAARPLVAFLNAYPQIPLLAKRLPAPKSTDLPSEGTVPNFPNNFSNYGDATLKPLTCLFDETLQSTTGNVRDLDPNLVGPMVTNVDGCQATMVPAFDLVPPADAATPNTRTFLDAFPMAPETPAKVPPDLNFNYAARVGTTGGLGILRLRQWVASDGATDSEILVQSNPTIKVPPSGSKTNPYVDQLLHVPAQYTPAKDQSGQSKNAVTILYSPGSDASYSPWGLGAYPTGDADLCAIGHGNGGAYTPDPARATATVASIDDEPILAVLGRSMAMERGGQQVASAYNLVVGWGLTTGTTYIKCGASLTTMAPPSVLYQPKPTTTCATCALPALQARTVCWNTGDTAPTGKAVPVPLIYDPLVPGVTPLPRPDTPPSSGDRPQGTLIDAPYVALGAAVGAASNLNGGHLGVVMPWVPLVTVPSGDPHGAGYGPYTGSPVTSAAYPPVIGECATTFSGL
jgi:hypothetical protein